MSDQESPKEELVKAAIITKTRLEREQNDGIKLPGFDQLVIRRLFAIQVGEKMLEIDLGLAMCPYQIYPACNSTCAHFMVHVAPVKTKFGETYISCWTKTCGSGKVTVQLDDISTELSPLDK